MTDLEFQWLLRFYLACLDAEDLRSLRKKLSALHRSVISPWDDTERLFHPEAAEVLFDVTRVLDRKLLLSDVSPSDVAERRFYGYPFFLDDEGFIAPLFFAEVQIEPKGETAFSMRHASAGEVQLNHHMFRRQRAQPEELRAIQEELEGEFGSFEDRLRAAFSALGTPMPDLDPERLDSYPAAGSPRNRWVNRPILFKSERSSYTHHLRRELEALAKYPRLVSEIRSTAAGTIAGLQPMLAGVGLEERDARTRFLPVLPLNAGQEAAALAGLKSPLTVVTGPPGTGKSQVVVDLLASCAASGRPVLFASKNNKAVDVVRDRLRAILGDEQDWCLRLGSRQVMEESREEMAKKLDNLNPAAVPKAPSPQELRALDEEIGEARAQIAELEAARVRYTGLDRARRLSRSLVDPAWIDSWEPGGLRLDLTKIERLAAIADGLSGRRTASLLLRLTRSLFPGLTHRRMRAQLLSQAVTLPGRIRQDVERSADTTGAANPFAQLADACQALARLARWRADEETCDRALVTLTDREPAAEVSKRLDERQSQRAAYACQQLRAVWTGRLAPRAKSVGFALGRYFGLSSRVRQTRGEEFRSTLNQFKSAVRTVGSDLPVWIVTSLSVRNAAPLEPGLFDLVIIDEASQCDIPSALPLLFRAHRALVIGDPQQLRHISTLSVPEEERLAAEHGVADLLPDWSYNQCSLYARAEGALIEQGGERLRLSEHYRSHPDIIEFSNNRFYGGELILRTDLDKLSGRLGDHPLGLFWHDAPGGVPSTSRSAWNEIEVQAVLGLLDRWAEAGLLLRKDVDVGIVTPFRLQMEKIEAALSERPWWRDAKGRVTVGTAHRFQGDERDVMIFSPVVSTGMSQRFVRWVADTDQLLNVAVTRARGALHVVGDLAACRAAGGHLGHFAASVHDERLENMAAAQLSPPESRMAELLTEVGLWFKPEHEVRGRRLDFFVVSPLGARYDIEVDDRGHRTDKAVLSDDIRDAAVSALGYKVVRVDARRIFEDETGVRALLQRLA